MDTDSLYMALSGPSLEDVISPSKRHEFYSNFHHWLPSQSCSRHRQQWIEKRCLSQDWTPDECCLEQQRYDKRTPGLFKTEWEGTAMVCLCSKTYFGKGSQPKQVCKGFNTKQNVFSLETYLNVIKNQASGFGTNKSFRVKDLHLHLCVSKLKLHLHQTPSVCILMSKFDSVYRIFMLNVWSWMMLLAQSH